MTAAEALRAGGIVALADVSSRYPQGYVLQLAERVTPASVTFMVTHARGLVRRAARAALRRTRAALPRAWAAGPPRD